MRREVPLVYEVAFTEQDLIVEIAKYEHMNSRMKSMIFNQSSLARNGKSLEVQF
jgi:hypothetical protein